MRIILSRSVRELRSASPSGPSSTRSPALRHCGSSGSRVFRLRGRWECRPPPSAESCDGQGFTGLMPSNRPRRSSATSGSAPASCCIWTSRNSRVSGSPAPRHREPPPVHARSGKKPSAARAKDVSDDKQKRRRGFRPGREEQKRGEREDWPTHQRAERHPSVVVPLSANRPRRAQIVLRSCGRVQTRIVNGMGAGDVFHASKSRTMNGLRRRRRVRPELHASPH